MVCLTDPQGRKQQFSYSEQGDLLKRIMPGGATWQWSHDALHQVLEIVAPDGGITQTEQDFLGRLLTCERPAGIHHAVPAQSEARRAAGQRGRN
ncbi:RHS repeat domain-containing protein [Citrobacter freundii]|uniref:RHS repeat domain-containing protein n=1 Tax=Citrobacter freundii TaxID=546 RepID=UPI001EE70804|nr:RHS repeat domain-containing protein [Citrobacter freundii]